MEQGDRHTNFSSHQEEILFWKSRLQLCSKEKDELQNEFDDFQSHSQQLEKELEYTIRQDEKRIQEQNSTINRYQSEVEILKKKTDCHELENRKLLEDLEASRLENIKFKKIIRELEQKNDDLERAERTFVESVSGVEASLNVLLERNAMLESEMDEKENLKIKLQRLVDETRDLKQELQVKEKVVDNDRYNHNCTEGITRISASETVDSNRLTTEHHTQTTPLKRAEPRINGESQFSPTTRILALNLVGDLLRKVGNLEAKLNSNGFLKDFSENPKNRQRSRGRSSSNLQNISKMEQ